MFSYFIMLYIPADAFDNVDCWDASSIGAPSGPVVTNDVTPPWLALPLTLVITVPNTFGPQVITYTMYKLITTHYMCIEEYNKPVAVVVIPLSCKSTAPGGLPDALTSVCPITE